MVYTQVYPDSTYTQENKELDPKLKRHAACRERIRGVPET